jgi:hypothetical protein
MNFDNITNTQFANYPIILNKYDGFIYSNTVSSNYLSISGDASKLVNLKLDYQSNLTFPPLYLNANELDITTAPYANGKYIINASSFFIGNEPFKCFYNSNNTEWRNASSNAYNGVNGLYNSTFETFIVNNSSNYRGEWIQLYYDKGFTAKSISIISSAANNINSPKSFIVAGSFNGTTWTMLYHSNGEIIENYTIKPIQTFNLTNFISYNYYRLIVLAINGNNYLKIIGLSFSGNLNSTFNNTDLFNKICYNTIEKQFPNSNFTSSPTIETINSNELFNIAPSNYYKQTLELPNRINYIIYSSSTSGNTSYNKQYLFNYNTSSSALNFGRWQSLQYNSSTGIYSSSSNATIGLNNTYYGDWIIIKFPFSIILTSFRIWQTSVPDKSPKRWKCYGSQDGVNWTEITEAASPLSGASYLNQFIHITIPNIYLNTPYLYFGWIFNSLMGSTATELEFAELQIFGKDDFANAYLNFWNKSDGNNNIYNTIGNIGIGKINPETALDVNGTITGLSFNQIGTSNNTFTGQSIFNTNNNAIKINSTVATASNNIQFQNNINYSGFIGLGGSSVLGNYASNLYIETTNSSIILNANKTSISTTPSMILLSNGNVGIGTINPIKSLHVIGEILASSDITAYSDKRLKENIVKLSDVEYVFNSIHGYSFNWNKTGQELLNKKNEEIEVGLIAQEIQSVIPSAVSVNEDDDNYLTLKYNKIIPYLVEGYKLLNDKYNKQQEQINKLLEIKNK